MVNFLICGTQKGGTTALDAYLRAHPKIAMARIKEVHFFDQDQWFVADPPDYAYYHRHFEQIASRVGEATPIYLYWQAAAERIWHYNPAMQLIVLLRNPITRAYSHWNMERARHAESWSFAEAIRQESARCREALPQQHRVYSYVDRGFYSEQLRRLWRYFDRDQVLVLKSEALQLNPQQTLDQVCDFLEIERLTTITPQQVHVSPYTSPISAADWDYLKTIFEYEIKQLERMLDWDCRGWLNPPTIAHRQADAHTPRVS